MMKRLIVATALLCSVGIALASEGTIKSGHVLGNATGSERTPLDTSILDVINQAGSGLVNVSSATDNIATRLSGVTSGDVYVKSSNTQLTANLTTQCPAGVRLHFPAGAKIVQTGSFTANFNCAIDAPLTQIFSGFSPGQITFGPDSNPAVWAEWFGASPSATSAVNGPAIQSAAQAALGGRVRIGAGTFLVAGVGSPSNTNGGAITINDVNDPSLLGLDFGGAGVGVTTLKSDSGSYFNTVEVVDTTNGQRFMPVVLHDMTIDGGSGSGNHQQCGSISGNNCGTGGDRYQNAFNGQAVSGLRGYNLRFTNAPYHGLVLNSTVAADFTSNIETDNNRSDGFLLTYNAAGPIWGVDNKVTAYSHNNGIGNNPTGFQFDTSDNGCVIIGQKNVEVRCHSEGNNALVTTGTVTPNPFPGALYIAANQSGKVWLSSKADRVGWYGATDSNSGIYDTYFDLNIDGATDVGMRDVSGVGSQSILGNRFALNIQNSGNHAMQIGQGSAPVKGNTFTGTVRDLTSGTAKSLIQIGANYSYNKMTNFTAGDMHGGSNISYFVEAANADGTSTTDGGYNVWSEGTGVGTGFQADTWTGLAASDRILTNMYGTLAPQTMTNAMITGCGTGSPAVSGLSNMLKGQVTVGTSATSCSIVVTKDKMISAPNCVPGPNASVSVPYWITTAVDTIQFHFGSAVSGLAINWVCPEP